MRKMSFEKTKIGTFFARRGFFVALAVCLLAIGAAGWFAVGSLLPSTRDSVDNDSRISSYQVAENSSQSTVDVGNPVSDVPAPPAESSEPDAPQDSSEPDVPAEPTDTAPEATFFVLPVSGDITKEFSDTKLQYSETCRDWRLHPAIDIAGEKGGKVNAAGDGKVSDVYTDPLWGTTVEIDHGNGVISYYSGLDKNVKVNKGDVVDVNQCIGLIGTVPCECIEAVHLHFAMKQNDKWVSPLVFMDLLADDTASSAQ